MGYLMLAGGAEFGGQMRDPDLRAIELAGGFDAPLRIIPTAAAPDNNHQRAGNNGLRSIIGRVGNDFVRVRIGIGRPPAGVTVTDYVLSRMDPVVKDAIPKAADAVEFLVEHGPEAAMNRFNVGTL